MESLDLSKLLSSQPELYAILAVLLYAVKKIFPILKISVETQKSHLECLQRIEQKTDANTAATQDNTSTLKNLLNKDDVIDLLLHRPSKKVVNGSGSVLKQGIE
jgi:hypothetical protein